MKPDQCTKERNSVRKPTHILILKKKKKKDIKLHKAKHNFFPLID